ncbi:hypothetical protein BH23BAC4_BH23BAC4_04940 [soil metagenome]
MLINDTACAILRIPEKSKYLGKMVREVGNGHEEDYRAIMEVAMSREPLDLGIIDFSDQDGGDGSVSLKAFPLPDRAVGVVFENVSDRLRAEEEVKRSERQLQAAHQIAKLGSWQWDQRDNRITWSDQMYRIFGYDPDHDPPDFDAYLSLIHPDDQENMRDALKEAVEMGTVYELTHRVVRPDGEILCVTARGEPLQDERGDIIGLQGTGQDVTAQEAARVKLRQYTDELESANNQLVDANAKLEDTNRELADKNQELEQFAYVASHDLQEPLRMVSSFLQLLERRHGDNLDESGRAYIGYAVDGAQRMQQLIHDLLAYSRVGSGESPNEIVSAENAVKEVLADLRPAIAERNASIEVGDLPEVAGDPSHLRQLLQNLLTNAMKFVKEGNPVIRVWAEEVADPHDNAGKGWWQFSVQDNGIGIEKHYADRVFQIFQRLHTRDEFEGTGIGLAICKRIVDRHGGQIWIETPDEGGARFCFTLPKPRNSAATPAEARTARDQSALLPR